MKIRMQIVILITGPRRGVGYRREYETNRIRLIELIFLERFDYPL